METTGPTGAANLAIPDILTLADILSERDIVLGKEATDKSLIDSIGGQSAMSLKPKLVEWVMKGKPSAYPIMMFGIQPPAQCSDGVVRTLADYIEFCSGKPIQDHVNILQSKLIGMNISFANIGGNVAIVVST